MIGFRLGSDIVFIGFRLGSDILIIGFSLLGFEVITSYVIYMIGSSLCGNMLLNQGWEVQGLGSRIKVLRFASLGGKRFEVQGSTCQESFFKV
jgi:hypothetical protein